MAKGKVAAKAIKTGIQGAKIGGTAAVAEKAIDVLDSKALSAAEGACNMSQMMSPVCCNECGNMVGVLPLGWEIPQFLVCIPCRRAELEEEE